MTKMFKPLESSVGDGIKASRAAWSFGGKTPQNFEQHIGRSVPHYQDGHDIILQLSDFFMSADSLCYDIGTSTGKLISLLAERHNGKGNWIGIDLEPSMTEFASKYSVGSNDKNLQLHYECANACQYEYDSCDLIVAYYTIQFIKPRDRQNLINTL
ncbi:MAG: methyltransferase domain-containing protein, partial [Sphingobacteriales bacterium]